MLITWLVLLVAVVGLLMMVLASNPKLEKIGTVLFASGTLVTLFGLAHATVHLP